MREIVTRRPYFDKSVSSSQCKKAYTVCMRSLFLSFLFATLLLPVLPLAAQSVPRFDAINVTRYTDASWDRPTTVAVSLLTSLGIVQGYPDGNFYRERRLNRAEFLKIVLEASGRADVLFDAMIRGCFPDVAADQWFAYFICFAKDQGIIQGNLDGLFHPERSVNYAEAAKILVEAFSLPTPSPTDTWYAQYIGALEHHAIALTDLQPSDALTRGDMARLTAAMLAFRDGRLEEYRRAEQLSSSGASSSSRSSVSSASSKSAEADEDGSVASVSSTPVATPIHSDVLLLGTVSPLLAGVQFFSSLEPLQTDALLITLTDDPQSVSSILVYDENGTLLGAASRSGGTYAYRLTLSSDAFLLPQRTERSIFVAARIAGDGVGGRSGDRVQIATIRLEATGVWSDEPYTIDSTSVFPVFQTALARIVSVRNAGVADAIFSPGDDQVIAAFTFDGEEIISSADLRVTSLAFDYSASAHFTLNAVELGLAGSQERSSCTVSSTRILCADLPASIGRIDKSQAIRIYADVTVSGQTGTRSLQLTLDEPGLPDQVGDAIWTDGTTTFTWLGLDRPLATGTRWR